MTMQRDGDLARIEAAQCDGVEDLTDDLVTLAQVGEMEARCEAAESGPEDLATLLAFWKQARTDLPALLRSYRRVLEALGELHDAVWAVEISTGGKPMLDAVDRWQAALNRAARILDAAKGQEGKP